MMVEKQAPRRFDITRVIATLLRPRQAFESAREETRSTWLTPMLLLSVTSLLVVLISGYLKTRAAAMGEIPLPPDWQYWNPEMQNNYMQAHQLAQGKVFMYVIPLVSAWAGLWLGWLVLAGILHLGSTLLGGRGSMQNALTVTAWAYLPFAIRDVLRTAYMISVGHAILSPGLSGFITTGGFTAQLLAFTDIFLLWNILLLIIGFAITDGLPRGKAILDVLLVELLLLALQAGAGTMIARLSGGVVG
ncbi:MAG TPA: Yip1 family protein [Candidatus Angelobacter sp.]|nr:Yip1 family protein [Candidatus Angelobacter sp.]